MISIPIPTRMADLPRDRRGYAIPWAVFTDADGRAHFQINDDRKRVHCLTRDLCPICGRKLTRGRWFVGGPMSVFHPNGAFADPPMHFECMRYAVAACPYLAAPSYAGRLDDKTLKTLDDENRPPLLLDHTVIVRRPDLFVAVLARSQRLVGSAFAPNVIPSKPYIRVEYWRHGEQLHDVVGQSLVDADRQGWPKLLEEQLTVARVVPARMGRRGRADGKAKP
jgi:hypothetical protein